MGNGDWGLGIGDWAQSPIPNPQSPIPISELLFIKYNFYLNNKILISNNNLIQLKIYINI